MAGVALCVCLGSQHSRFVLVRLSQPVSGDRADLALRLKRPTPQRTPPVCAFRIMILMLQVH